MNHQTPLTAGKIYQVGYSYGLALYHEQPTDGKIFLHLFNDANLTDRKLCEKTGKPLIAIKTKDEIRLLGYNE